MPIKFKYLKLQTRHTLERPDELLFLILVLVTRRLDRSQLTGDVVKSVPPQPQQLLFKPIKRIFSLCFVNKTSSMK